MDKKYNIVLLTVDALRYDHCGFNGYKREVTPKIDNFAKKGVIFDSMYSNGPCTPPSFCSMFSGTYPFDKGGFSPLPDNKITIAAILKENGYQTAGFNSNPLISHYFKYHKGFTKYFDSMTADTRNPAKKKILGAFESDGQRSNALFNQLQNLKIPKVIQTTVKKLFYRIFLGRDVKYYIPAAGITRRAIRWLRHHYFQEKDIDRGKLKEKKIKKIEKKQEKKKLKKPPFFLWVHYMDTHDPFIPKWRHLKQLNSKISRKEFEHNNNFPEYTDILKEYNRKSKLIDLYNAEILAVDEKISDIVDFFKLKNIYHKTIFILTADHGEEFNDHGDYGHRAHLYDELIHVPFLLFGGPIEKSELHGLEPGSRITDLMSLIRLPATILEFCNISGSSDFDAGSFNDALSTTLKDEKNSIPSNHVMACTYHKGIVTRFNLSSDRTIKQLVSVRTEKHKYIYDTEMAARELYDLENDPLEKQNIADNNKDLCEKFQNLCDNYLNGKGYHVGKKKKPLGREKKRIVEAMQNLKMKL